VPVGDYVTQHWDGGVFRTNDLACMPATNCRTLCEWEPSFVFASETNHAYRVIYSELAYPGARAACAVAGGVLAAITSTEEAAFLERLDLRVWIGGNRNAGPFAWETGEPWAFEDWDGGAPSGIGDCIVYDGRPDAWRLQPCTSQAYFLCEFD
jgi:hypothetical protein